MRRLTALLVAGIAFGLYYLVLFEVTKDAVEETDTPVHAPSPATSAPADKNHQVHAAVRSR